MHVPDKVMDGSNPNTISNFSQSWQRATHFRGLDFRNEADIQPPENTDPEKCSSRLELEYPKIPTSIQLSPSLNYGTTAQGNYHSIPAFAHLSSLMARQEQNRPEKITGSTVLMTIFNCTNMLIGVGTLSLALGLLQCGWIVGLIMLTIPALVTIYTARLLVRCLDAEHICLSDRIACWALIVIGLICALAGTLSLILK
jgi:hypothetical protein